MKLRTLLVAAVLMQTGAAFGIGAPAPATDAVAKTRAQVTALRDEFVKATQASRLHCAVPVPTIVVQDVPSFGSYDPDTNTLTSPAWEQMTGEEQAIFYKGLGPGATEASARAEFEVGVHHWVLIHEMGHWWEACRGVVDHGDHYQFEFVADRIAAAYWTRRDPSVIAQQKAVVEAILQKGAHPL